MPARTISGLFTLLAMAVVAAALALVMNTPGAVRGPGRAPGGNEERLEQQLDRTPVGCAARGAGCRCLRQTGAGRPRRRPGMGGRATDERRHRRLGAGDAADPNAPFVYMVSTRYAPKPCPGTARAHGWRSGSPRTEEPPGVPGFRCACKGSAQFDPIIEVVPNTGHVYALYMNGFNTVFSSTNHGQTWSTPVPTYGQVSWTDKPVLAMSNDGQHVYVSWNGPNAGDPYVAQSHNAGATWTQTKLVNGPRYFFAYDADVLPNGTVVFSESSIDYGGQGRRRPARSNIMRSCRRTRAPRGATCSSIPWRSVNRAWRPDAPRTSTSVTAGVSADASGNLVMVYDGATTPGGKQLIFSRRSTNGGLTWSARTALSPASEQSTAPVVESRGAGDVRMVRPDERREPRRLEHLVPGSTDGGDLGRAGQHLRRDLGRRLQDGRRVPGVLRRLRESPSRTPGRRSVSGARPSATPVREGPGSTGRPDPGLRGPVGELFLLRELVQPRQPSELGGGLRGGLLGRLLVAEHLRVLGLGDVGRRREVRGRPSAAGFSRRGRAATGSGSAIATSRSSGAGSVRLRRSRRRGGRLIIGVGAIAGRLSWGDGRPSERRGALSALSAIRRMSSRVAGSRPRNGCLHDGDRRREFT